MSSKVKIWLIVIAFIVLTFTIPLFLEYVIYRNDIYSVMPNSDWSGFFGSFLGGILGGIGTLLAVYITTYETRKIQEETQELSLKVARKGFTDKVAEVVSEYITDISDFAYSAREMKRLDEQKHRIMTEISDIKKKIDFTYERQAENIENSTVLMETSSNIEKLQIDFDQKNIELNELNRSIERTYKKRVVADNCYFLLNIKLKNIVAANQVLEQLDYIHNNSGNPAIGDCLWADKECNKLLEMTTVFIDSY